MYFEPAKVLDMSSYALASAIPLAADTAPPAVGDTNDKGASSRYALKDHTHATSVQRASVTLNASGVATWTFSTAYPSTPIVNVSPEVSSGLPVIIVITSVSTTAVSVKGYRFQVLPSSLVVLTALQLFDITAGTAPNGVKVQKYPSFIAVQAS